MKVASFMPTSDEDAVRTILAVVKRNGEAEVAFLSMKEVASITFILGLAGYRDLIREVLQPPKPKEIQKEEATL